VAARIPKEICDRFETADKLSDEDRKPIVELARGALAPFQPKPEAKPEPDQEPEKKPGPDAKAKHKPEPKASKSTPDTESKSDQKDEPKPIAEPKPAVGSKPKAKEEVAVKPDDAHEEKS